MIHSTYKNRLNKNTLLFEEGVSPIKIIDTIAKKQNQYSTKSKTVVSANYDVSIHGSETEQDHIDHAKDCYNINTPKGWIEELKAISMLDLRFTDFIEMPTGEIIELTGLKKITYEEEIKRKRTEVYKLRVKQGQIQGLTEREFWKMWFPIVEINGERAVKDYYKSRIVSSKLQIFVLGEIKKKRQATHKNLSHDLFRNSEYKSRAISDKSLNTSLKALIKNKCISMEKFNGNIFYKLDKCSFEDGVFLKGE